jgi:DNA-directed RNA polymerase subunit RPC12/RpoP
MVTAVSTVPHPSVVKEVICPSCGSTLNYVPADIQERSVVDYDGTRELVNFIKCPPCNHEIFVKRY